MKTLQVVTNLNQGSGLNHYRIPTLSTICIQIIIIFILGLKWPPVNDPHIQRAEIHLYPGSTKKPGLLFASPLVGQSHNFFRKFAGWRIRLKCDRYKAFKVPLFDQNELEPK